MNVSIPMTSPRAFTPGPPLLPQEAAASVWITGAPRASRFTPAGFTMNWSALRRSWKPSMSESRAVTPPGTSTNMTVFLMPMAWVAITRTSR